MATDRFNDFDESAAQAAYEQAAEELGVDTTPRFSLQKGNNVLWILPPIGKNLKGEPNRDFVEPIKMHYGPKHACQRLPKRPNPADPTKAIDDRAFKNCVRCLAAWEAYEEAGKPGVGDKGSKDPQKKAWMGNLPSEQGLIQAVNFTPFFVQNGPGLELNKKFAQAHLTAYLDAILSGEESDIAALPEELQLFARAGVSVMYVNETTRNLLNDAHNTTRYQILKRKGISAADKKAFSRGLYRNPGDFLFNIRGEKSDKAFIGRDGKEQFATEYSVKMLTPDDLDEWKELLDSDKLYEIGGTQGINLANPDEDYGDDAPLSRRANGYARLSGDEILAYLSESGHSYDDITKGSAEESSDGSMSDPDSFGPPVSSPLDAEVGDDFTDPEVDAAIQEARAKTRARKAKGNQAEEAA